MSTKDVKELAIEQARKFGGKLEVCPKVSIETKADLGIAYTPSVAAVSSTIHEKKGRAYELTTRKNTVAVISDGSVVLGLGNIGPEAAMSAMERKAVSFKRFAGVDSIPLVLDIQDTEEIIQTMKFLASTFGGINLGNINAPRCFKIEQHLIDELGIPVFHDDRHGTAIVVLAVLYNSLKLINKKIEDVHVVINGGGSAGLSTTREFLAADVKHIITVDRTGILSETDAALPPHHTEIAKLTNREHRTGDLATAPEGADVFVGVSAPGVLRPQWIQQTNEQPVVFAMANPVPEVFPDETSAAGAYIAGTGRNDFPNQINNVLAFPGIFCGALGARAKKITIEMRIVAAKDIARLIPDNELTPTNIIPDPLQEGVAKVVAESVRNAVKETN